MQKRSRGLTLVELLIGIALLLVGGSALLLGMNTSMVHADFLTQMQIVLNAAQGRLEELSATSFDTLWTDARFGQARPAVAGALPALPIGLCRGVGEDANCDGVLNAGEDLNGNNRLDEPVPGARLSVQIRSADARNPANPALLDLYVSGCWASRGRAIGEDRNCNGRLDVGEDANGNTLMDGPVALTTRIGRAE